jgi:hypothetical protein
MQHRENVRKKSLGNYKSVLYQLSYAGKRTAQFNLQDRRKQVAGKPAAGGHSD